MLIEQIFMYLLKTYQGTKDLESNTLSNSSHNLSKGRLGVQRSHDTAPYLVMFQLFLIPFLGKGGHDGSTPNNFPICMFRLDGYLQI